MQLAKSSRELSDEILYVKHDSVLTLGSIKQRIGTDMYHAMTWPQLSYVAEDHKGRIVGYIMAKM
jgi:peptide alpha-N-acetyltransferase